MEDNKLVLECECGTHLLLVTNDVEQEDNKKYHHEFYLAFFTYGTYHKRPSLWEKLKFVWIYMKTGKMHEDQIILSTDEAKELMNYINDHLIRGGKIVKKHENKSS
jgi:hypothetical protein